MGLRDARARFIEALLAGAFDHEERSVKSERNLLAVGEIEAAEVIDLLQRCRGEEYRTSPHHFDAATTVHEFRPRGRTGRWYIKGYFMESTLFLISVHRTE